MKLLLHKELSYAELENNYGCSRIMVNPTFLKVNQELICKVFFSSILNINT